MLMQASRAGYFFVLDRATGKNLLTKPFGPVNWAKGIDEKGQPIPDPAKDPSRDGVLIAPNEAGLTNYRSPSVDTREGTVHRQRAGQLRRLFLQAGARRLRVGGRRLQRLGQGRC